ncbi:BLUF domain-containing protein [Campylobacterota bacterium]
MIRLIYVSQANEINFNKIKSILSVSHRRNKESNISGALIYGKGYFIQCLEGDDIEVEALYKKIIIDNRHDHIELISKENIQERYFKDWHISLMNDNAYAMIENKYTKDGVFNPNKLRPEQLLIMLDELSKVV